MLADALRTLYGYNRWATERVLDAAARLTHEQFLAPGTAGHGSVRDTLVHVIGTHRGWLSWWDGSLPVDEAYNLRLEPDDVRDLDAIRAVWEEVERQTEAFVSRLTDGDAARVYARGDWRMPLWRMMLHVANHSTQHRSEVAAMLTDASHSPGDLDLLYYPG